MNNFTQCHADSTHSTMQAVVLAAGHGSRLKTGISKMITPICGQAMVVYPLKVLEAMGIATTVVVGYQKELVCATIDKAQIKKIQYAEQTVQLGTGHALLASKHTWVSDTILVLNGDMPLINSRTIEQLYAEHRRTKATVTIATSHNVDPANTFGRIVVENNHIKIVEKKHFIYDIQAYPQVNVGMYIVDRTFLEAHADKVQQNNITQEFYITDLVEIASRNDLSVAILQFPFDLFHGVNTFQELAAVEHIKHDELVHYWMSQGVRFMMPHTNYLDLDVSIGRGTVIYPGVQLFNATAIGEFCTIKSNAVLDGVTLRDRSTVEAFALVEKEIIVPHVSSKIKIQQAS